MYLRHGMAKALESAEWGTSLASNECDRRQTHSVVAVAKMIMRNVIVAAAPAIELTTSRETRAAQFECSATELRSGADE